MKGTFQIKDVFRRAAALLALFITWVGYSQSALPTVQEEGATWYQWPISQGGNDHWYGLVRKSMRGPDADRIAKQWGGQLASYGEVAERDFLYRIATNQFHSQPYWIALVAPPGEPFRWTDGTSFNLEWSVFGNWTNYSGYSQRMAVTPFGTQQIFPDLSYSASLFEMTAHPSTLAPAIGEVTVLSLEVSIPLFPIVVSGPIKVRSPGVARFQILVLGPGPIEYQWMVGGAPVPQATNPHFDLLLDTSNSGAVSVVVKNANGEQESVPVPIEVIPIVETGTETFWKQWTKARGGNDHWYGIRYRQQGFTHAQALESARQLGADLVTLQSPEEKTEFQTLFFPHIIRCWLGVATNSAGGWDWLDGSSASDLEWAPGQPDFSGANPRTIIQVRDGGLCRMMPADTTFEIVAMERTNSPVEIPPIIVNQVAPLRIPVAATRSLQFDVLGGPPLSYEWRRGPQTLPGQTNAVLDLRPTSVLETDDYVLVVSNAFGAATSPPVSVTVFLPTPLQLKLSLADGYALLDYEHPADAESVVVERSEDLIYWGTAEESAFPGFRQWSELIIPGSIRAFYRLRSRP